MKSPSLILVTGATSGIGRASALALARAGHRVFASGRREPALATLAKEAAGTGLETLVLDVSSQTSIANAYQHIAARTGGYGVDAVVNSAGYGAMGPLEEISDDALRAQYETNVFGLMAVTRTFLPAMRARGFGRIVNISSIGGRVTAPMMGAYSSTKYAVESLSDALRVELRAFGVKVVLIEPGAIHTEFSEVAVAKVPSANGSPYAEAITGTADLFAAFAKTASSTATVTRAINKALFSRHPAARYIRPWRTYTLLVVARLVPTAWLDAAMAMLAGLTRKKLKPIFSRSLAALGIALTLFAATANASPGWEQISDKDGVTIERRVHAGSAFDELRASTTSPIAPEKFFATVSNYREFPAFVPYLKTLKVIDENGDKSHVYQQIAMPLVADRDYTLELKKRSDRETHVYQMLFESADAFGPPPHAPFVRATHIEGGWTLEPSDDGKGTRVTYFLYSEPGGKIPSWIVNLVQRDAPRALLLAMRHRAEE